MKNIKVEFEYNNQSYKATATLDDSFELNTRSKLNSDVESVYHYDTHLMCINISLKDIDVELVLIKMGTKLSPSSLSIFEKDDDSCVIELDRDEFKFNCRY